MILELLVIIITILLIHRLRCQCMSVPRIIHQTAPSDRTKWDPLWFKCQKSWKNKFPNYEYKLWTDEDNDNFIKNRFSWFYKTYTEYSKNIQRIDAVRYFIMYEYGGIYADMDYECINNFEHIIPQDKVSIAASPYKNNEFVQNALMAGPAKHPFWVHVFTHLEDYKNIPNVLTSTGPVMLEVALRTYEGDIHVLPSIHFSSVNSFSPYAIHHGTCSWCDNGGLLDVPFVYDQFIDEIGIPEDIWIPDIYDCYKPKIRLGNLSDGGYVICDDIGDYDCYISAGVGYDESFTNDFISRYETSNNFAFDGTIDVYPGTKPVQFINKNIDKHNNLNDIVGMYSNVFLKMDIEGGEYVWLDHFDLWDHVKQCVIEFHQKVNRRYYVEKLQKTHILVHAHGNNNEAPRHVIELTFIRRDCVIEKCEKSTEHFPTDLDYVNNPNKPDYVLI